MRLRRWLIITCVLGICLTEPVEITFAGWSDEPTLHHSSLSTSDPQNPHIYDSDFAGWISDYFTGGYSRMAFMFGQCYSGGFINDLKDFDNTVICTASDYDKTATIWPLSNYDCYANRWERDIRGGGPDDTVKNAHDAAKLFMPSDQPQYYSNPTNMGDSLKLNNNMSDRVHAILYVGNWENQEEQLYFKAFTETMFNTLTNYHLFPAENIDILFGNQSQLLNTPGAVTMDATPYNLENSLMMTGQDLNSNEQFFFWGFGHGTEVIPEPATFLLLGLGAVMLRRKR